MTMKEQRAKSKIERKGEQDRDGGKGNKTYIL